MPRKPSNTRRMEKCASAFTTTLRAPRNPSGTATTAATKVPRKAIATLSARPCRMSSHCAPGLGGIIRRRMTNSPDRPRVIRSGVMSNHQHRLTSQAANKIQPAMRVARWAGVRPKADGSRARARGCRRRRSCPRSYSHPADGARAQCFRGHVDSEHGEHDQHDDGADLLVIVEADHRIEFLADAAGADEADDGGAAHVDLEADQHVAQEVRQHLRQDGVSYRL